jgi:hypothetical protein
MVWCGDRKGRLETNVEFSGSLPATEWILVVSKASSRLNGGSIVGSLFANMVLPARADQLKLRYVHPLQRSPMHV